MAELGMCLLRRQRGLQVWLAPQLGLTQSTVSGWTRIPTRYVHDIERITGLPRYWLRPDLFAPPWRNEREWLAAHRSGTSDERC